MAERDRTATTRCDSRHVVVGSVARIVELRGRDLSAVELPRSEWDLGDYVLGARPPNASPLRIEVPSGRVIEAAGADLLLGALGRRAATLDLVGDWTEIGDDGRMHVLNAAGVLGRCSSAPLARNPPAELHYVGHAALDGEPISMASCARETEATEAKPPVVMIIGTSMSAGKTVAGRAIVQTLRRMGKRVAATKLTGVGRYRDVLAMADAGADPIADFVDGGLPSTVVERKRFVAATRRVLAILAAGDPDVIVAEAGASPLEPYNGDTLVEMLRERICFTVLCASDPYAVVGVMDAFGTKPDLISGLATGNDAGIELIDRLVGLPALNLLDPASVRPLRDLLEKKLGPEIA